MLYSKNGSIPQSKTDGTSGWIEVPDAPTAPAGKEVMWWYPPGWVVRDPDPSVNYAWNQSTESWVQIPKPTPISTAPQVEMFFATSQVASLSTSEISNLSSSQVSSLTTNQI
jgi:hypothetical protein